MEKSRGGGSTLWEDRDGIGYKKWEEWELFGHHSGICICHPTYITNPDGAHIGDPRGPMKCVSRRDEEAAWNYILRKELEKEEEG